MGVVDWSRLRDAGWLVLALLMSGCIETFLGDDVENTPEANFEVLWQDLDRYYALFEHKNVHWDSLYTVFREGVTPATSDEDLFQLMCAMIRQLNDGHVVLQTGNRDCTSRLPSSLPPDDLNLRLIESLLEEPFQFKGEGRLQYGRVAEQRKAIGYVYIRDFTGDGTPVADWVQDIEEVLEELSDVDALIVDVRSNGGGNGFNAADMVGRFTETAYPYLVTQTRNGPAHSDLTEPRTWSIEPKGTPFLKPVALLTNRHTFSAAEWFVLGMKSLPHVRTMGDNTGGGLSSRLFRTLPNGWSFSISIQQSRSIEGMFFESVGIEPEIRINPGIGAVVRPDVILRESLKIINAE